MTRLSLIFSCLTVSVTQSSPKLSQAKQSTGRGPSNRPHRHLHRAGVGRRHDADAIVGRNAEHARVLVDGVLELGFARLWSGASAPAARRSSASGVQPGRLAQGPDEKKGRAGRTAGHVPVIIHSFQNDRASLGRRGPQLL